MVWNLPYIHSIPQRHEGPRLRQVQTSICVQVSALCGLVFNVLLSANLYSRSFSGSYSSYRLMSRSLADGKFSSRVTGLLINLWPTTSPWSSSRSCTLVANIITGSQLLNPMKWTSSLTSPRLKQTRAYLSLFFANDFWLGRLYKVTTNRHREIKSKHFGSGLWVELMLLIYVLWYSQFVHKM